MKLPNDVQLITEGSGKDTKYYAQLGADAASKKLLGNSIVLEYGTRTVSVVANGNTYIRDIVFKESYVNRNIMIVPYSPSSGGAYFRYEFQLNSNRSGLTSLRVANMVETAYNNQLIYYFVIDLGALG